MSVQGQNTPQRLTKGIGQVCERAIGLSSLFTVEFAGPARSLFVAAYRIDSSQGELSKFACERCVRPQWS